MLSRFTSCRLLGRDRQRPRKHVWGGRCHPQPLSPATPTATARSFCFKAATPSSVPSCRPPHLSTQPLTHQLHTTQPASMGPLPHLLLRVAAQPPPDSGGPPPHAPHCRCRRRPCHHYPRPHGSHCSQEHVPHEPGPVLGVQELETQVDEAPGALAVREEGVQSREGQLIDGAGGIAGAA